MVNRTGGLKRAQESWAIFKNTPLQCAGGGSSVAERQCGWTGHSWLSWNEKRNCTGGGSRDRLLGRNMETLPECRDGVVKVKAHLELKLARDVKIHKKGFFYSCWQPRKIWDPQLNSTGVLEAKDVHRVADWIKKKISKNFKNFEFCCFQNLILFIVKLKKEYLISDCLSPSGFFKLTENNHASLFEITLLLLFSWLACCTSCPLIWTLHCLL